MELWTMIQSIRVRKTEMKLVQTQKRSCKGSSVGNVLLAVQVWETEFHLWMERYGINNWCVCSWVSIHISIATEWEAFPGPRFEFQDICSNWSHLSLGMWCWQSPMIRGSPHTLIHRAAWIVLNGLVQKRRKDPEGSYCGAGQGAQGKEWVGQLRCVEFIHGKIKDKK